VKPSQLKRSGKKKKYILDRWASKVKIGVMVVDDYSSYSWRYYLKEMHELKERIVKIFEDLKDQRLSVKLLRLDDS
jgi:hypothetical protein